MPKFAAASAERLIWPLTWLQPGILLAAIAQLPFGDRDGWINLAVYDSADPALPHVLTSASLRQNAAHAYCAIGIPGLHASLTPIVRALCVTACRQLEDEQLHGRPLRPLSLPPRRAELRRSEKQISDKDTSPISAMERGDSRKKLVANAVIALDTINRAPVGVLPLLENGAGFLPCEELVGWFRLQPMRPARRTAAVKEAISA